MSEKLPVELDVTGWEHIDCVPTDKVLIGCEYKRPGVIYFMMWWEPTQSWEFVKPNAEGTKMVLDQSRDWKPEPTHWMLATRVAFNGWPHEEGAIDPETVKPGDIIKVKVGGVEYDTVIDPRGVQRFVENREHWLVKQIPIVWDRATAQNVDDMNVMARRYHHGEFSQRDYAEMNMAVGYSVDGFCDLSNFQDMEIENPLWG